MSIVAQAHSVGTSYLHIEQRASTAPLEMRVDLSLRDLEFAIGLDSNHDTRITWGEVVQNRATLTRYVSDRLQIERGDQPCTFAAPDLLIDHHSDGPYAVLQMPLLCPRPGRLAVQSNLMFDIDDSHRTLLNIDLEPTHIVTVLTSGTRTWTEPLNHLGRGSALLRFVEQGIWHIWTGFDHLAFLLLLLLPLMRQQRDRHVHLISDVLRVVTAFTLAHSITLACAAFNFVRLPSRFVEAAIAASIVVTGLANLFPRAARFSVLMAFGFGLIHGLGFASALAELTRNTESRLLPLIGFNVGVELGQLVVVALLFPLLFLGKRTMTFQTRVAAVGSVSISLLGMLWLIERTVWV